MEYRSNAPIYLLIAFVLSITLFAAYRSNIITNQIQDYSVINLPAGVKNRMLTDNGSELMYVNYRNRQIQFYHASINEHRRVQIIKLFKQLAISIRYNIPEGDYLLILHDGAHVGYEIPIISFSSTQELVKNKQVILMPDPDSITGYKYNFKHIDQRLNQYPWNKKESKIFWRGSATGAGEEMNDLSGKGFDRLRFINYVKDLPYVDAGFSDYTPYLNPTFRKRLGELHKLKPWVKPEDSLGYKYLIDIDGNSCSYARMAWILYSNSVLMKHISDKMQWYYPQMQAYVHYIPISNDFTNLKQQFDWAETHPEEAKAIAQNGRRFAKQVFSKDGVIQAASKAFNEYQQVLLKQQSQANNL
jgi:hypothetical protein